MKEGRKPKGRSEKKNAGGKNSNSYLKIKSVQTLQAAAKQEIYNFPCKEITNTETRSFFLTPAMTR